MFDRESMMSHSSEHIHFALEISISLLLIGAWILLRRRRQQKEYTSREHEAQLHQKDLHIREVYHRVANQMGLTAALLHLQATRSVHPDAKASLFDSENRIRTLSKLHTKLQQTDPHSRTLLYPYLSEVAGDLIHTLRPDLGYCQELGNDSPSTPSTTAITCGLLVHELITNCIKHAFPQNRIGTIRLSLHCPPTDRLRISIHDNGTGLPPGFTIQNSSTSGMAIVSALTKDLAGTFTAIRHPSGTEFIAEFPLSEIEPTL